MAKVTQKDVAEAAGVSQALVSTILSGDASAREVCQERHWRVIAAAERLGYKPRKKRATKGKDKLLAFVSAFPSPAQDREPWLQNSLEGFYGRLYEHVQIAALERGLSTMHYPISNNTDLTRWLSEWEIAGVLWNYSYTSMLSWVSERFPVVQLERSLLRNVDSCLADQETLIFTALEHLQRNGHRRVGYISKAPHTDYIALQRKQAIAFNAERLGMEVYELESGREALHTHFQSPQRVGAVIAPDLVCFLILQILGEVGLRCPDDVSVLGIDNLSACNFSSPPLTSVDLNFQETANVALDLLQARMGGATHTARRIHVTPQLVERASVQSIASVASSAPPLLSIR